MLLNRKINIIDERKALKAKISELESTIKTQAGLISAYESFQTELDASTARVYVGSLATRLITRIKIMIAHERHNKGRMYRVKMSTISRSCGISTQALYSYMSMRVTMPIQIVDKLLYYMDLSVVDLLEAKEFASAYHDMTRQERYKARQVHDSIMKKALDIPAPQVQNDNADLFPTVTQDSTKQL